MSDPIRATPGELTADEIVSAVEDGRRVIVKTERWGREHQLLLRYDGSIYFCDTPTTLHKHQTPDGMRSCLLGQGYATDSDR